MKPLPLRTSLTLAYTGMLAVIVTAVAFGYHRLLVRQVDLDATAGVEELVRGLHGYLQFRNGQPAFVFDQRDADAAAFIGEATHYYQVYDLATGKLLAQSASFALAGVDYTPAEVVSFREPPAIHDVQTDRGRLRISSSVVTGADGHEYLLQVGSPSSHRPFNRQLRAAAALGHRRRPAVGGAGRPLDGGPGADAAVAPGRSDAGHRHPDLEPAAAGPGRRRRARRSGPRVQSGARSGGARGRRHAAVQRRARA